jgi:hypothetical protein
LKARTQLQLKTKPAKLPNTKAPIIQIDTGYSATLKKPNEIDTGAGFNWTNIAVKKNTAAKTVAEKNFAIFHILILFLDKMNIRLKHYLE